MSKKSNELRQKRAKAIADARSILDKADGERRQLSNEDRAAYDKHMADINRLGIEILEQEGLDEEEKRAAGRSFDLQHGGGGEGEGPVFQDHQTGREIRGLLPSERLEDTVAPPREVRAQDLSFGRWLRGAVTGDWQNAQAEQRVQAAGTDTLGGYLVPSALAARVIDLARNRAAVVRAGAITVPMTTPELRMATVEKDPTASWRRENEPGEYSDSEFGLIVMSAKKLIGLTKVSVEAIEDAANIGQLVENGLAQALALELDRAALYGTGGSMPVGLTERGGTNTLELAENGRTPKYSDLSQALSFIEAVNGPDNASMLIHPTDKLSLELQVDSTDQPLRPPESWDRLRKFSSTQLPHNLTHGTADNASHIIVGNFSECLIGMRTAMTIEVSRETDGNFEAAQVSIRAYMRCDVGFTRLKHFTIISGVIPTSP